MKVLNVHERQLAVPAERAGALLERLASKDDGLWPRVDWPRMSLDRPLGIGAVGGHGPIRYVVVEHVPGERIRFRFTAPRGFEGTHRFEVERRGDEACVLRHSIEMDAAGPALLTWPFVFRPLHDALMEDALDRAQDSLGLPARSRAWSPWVRFLRRVLRRR